MTSKAMKRLLLTPGLALRNGSAGGQSPATMRRRVVACGRGRDICHPVIRDEIVSLSGKATPSLLYLGTPAFERPDALSMQTCAFHEIGCEVVELQLTDLEQIPNRAFRRAVTSCAGLY